MYTFDTLLKSITSEQLSIVCVSTDPLRWCDRFYNLNLTCISRRVEMTLYTLGFHMQLRSWKLKLQPKKKKKKKIMSYLDKRHVTHITHFQAWLFSLCLIFDLSHSQMHARFKRWSHSCQVFVSFSFLPIRLQCPKHLCWISICTFKTAWITVSLKELVRCD